jgi:hypothetical protein
MEVNDLHMLYLRAQLAGDEAAMRKALALLVSPHALDPLPVLVYEAFVIAIRKWAGAQFTHARVIQLVAEARAFFGEEPGLADPVAAESEVLRALGQDTPLFEDADVRAAAHMVILDFLVRKLDFSDTGVDDLLEQARDAANQALATGGSELSSFAISVASSAFERSTCQESPGLQSAGMSVGTVVIATLPTDIPQLPPPAGHRPERDQMIDHALTKMPGMTDTAWNLIVSRGVGAALPLGHRAHAPRRRELSDHDHQ